MGARRPQLAKLSKPRLHKAVARERMLSLLDDKREYPAVWVAAPPGAGKTTLAANYIDEANANAVWFQIDSGDSDPATFFYYLKKAVEQKSRRKGKPLQLFTPEYLSDIAGFARRFFRDAFLRLREDVLLVFDNYHELEPQSPLHAGFSAAMEEIPLGANVLVLSRADPPPAFAQAIVHRTIAKVSWEEIKLTTEEAGAIAAARGVNDAKIVNELQRQTDGWVAGLTLMLEGSPDGGAGSGRLSADTLETLFEYFSHVIFDEVSHEAQDVMLRTAMLPYVTAELVEAVTGSPEAIRHIRVLQRRHLFVSRTPGAVDTYQFHTMFRAFLRVRVQAALSVDEIRNVRVRAASSLEATGDLSSAFDLFVQAENWGEAVNTLIKSAQSLIVQGRWRTLQDWVSAIPEKQAAKNPWIQYWLGRSYIWVDHSKARPILEAVYDKFSQSDDRTGQTLAAAGVLQVLVGEHDYQQFHEMDAWIELLSTHVNQGVSFPTADDEVHVYSMLVRCLFSRMPDHPRLHFWVDRVKAMAKEIEDPNLIIVAASSLMVFVHLSSEEAALEASERIAKPVLRSRDVKPLNLGLYLADHGYTHYTFGRYPDALTCFDLADAIGNEHGLVGVLQRTAFARALCARRSGMHDVAEQSVRRFAELRNRGRVAGPSTLAFLEAAIAYDRGEYDKAISRALEVENEIQSEGDHLSTMLFRIVPANFLAGSGAPREAKRLLELARTQATGPNTSHYRGSIALNEAWAEHLEGKEDDRDTHLREALEWARDKRSRLRYHWFTNALEDLLPVALERNIDPDTALQLARDLKISQRDASLEHWPWRIKVYTLGEFKLLIDGQSPSYSRKLPKKSLALLKAIIAFGGKDVAEQKLLDALWPDAEGDAAQRALSATVHRLRKLLDCPKAVRQSGGVLSLDEKVCWVDAIAFERRIRGNGDNRGLALAIQAYRGSFLPNETDSPWLASFREHLKSKFTDAVSKLGAHLEEHKQFEEAMALYTRGIEADNLVESFYQGQMRCYQKLGRRSEALNAYRRLRDILSITLGVEPSPRSRQMMQELRPD